MKRENFKIKNKGTLTGTGPSQRLPIGSRLKYRTTNFGGFSPFDMQQVNRRR